MGSCAAPSAKGDDKFITTDYLQQCLDVHLTSKTASREELEALVSEMQKNSPIHDTLANPVEMITRLA
ncbi:hypothetical protein CP909_28460 [Klebsiella pneumoniae]|nr:hypothetical protein CP909_28460 [Klebsiella pneumoniae]